MSIPGHSFFFVCLGLSSLVGLLPPARSTAVPMLPEPSGLTSKVFDLITEAPIHKVTYANSQI